MKVLLLASLLAAACAISVPYGMEITWTVEGDSAVFYFAVPYDTHSSFGWSGMGIKNLEDGSQMVNGDYVSVVYDPVQITDRHGVRNGRPKPDTEQQGTDDINESTDVEDDGAYFIYTWTRLLNTGDVNDTQLEIGKQYYLQWAVGDVDGDVIKHHKESGSLTVVFTEDSVQPTSFLSID